MADKPSNHGWLQRPEMHLPYPIGRSTLNALLERWVGSPKCMDGRTKICYWAADNRRLISSDAVGVHFSEWLMTGKRPLGFMRRATVLFTTFLLMATAMAGCLDSMSSNAAPIVSFTISPSGTIKVGETVTFDASATRDPVSYTHLTLPTICSG